MVVSGHMNSRGRSSKAISSRAAQIVNELAAMGNQANVENKARRFGISTNNAVGVNQKEIRQIARTIGKDSELAIALFDSGIYEARLLCARVFDHRDLSGELMESWASEFDTWEICDSFCMGFFACSELAIEKIFAWSGRPELFVKRAAFSMMAAYGFAHKNEANGTFETFLGLIASCPSDERHYVKKGVNWALRNIGKRNPDLKFGALELAREFEHSSDATRRWIGAHARRELTSSKLRLLNYPRAVYGTAS